MKLHWRIDRKFNSKSSYKIFLITSALLLKLLLLILLYSYLAIHSKHHCDYLEDFPNLTSIFDVRRPKSQSIFFLVTPCKNVFTKRDACAVEAASRTNKNTEVFVLYTHPIRSGKKDLYLNAVLSYKNVNFIYLDVKKYIKGTPLEKLFHTRKLNRDFVKELLALLTLYRYGGIYLDLDVLILRDLKRIYGNFIGYDGETLNTSFMGFKNDTVAENYIFRIIDQINLRYNGENSVSPFITELIEELCDTKNLTIISKRQCVRYKVFPKEFFYPISSIDSKILYNKNPNENVFKIIKNSLTLNTFSKNHLNVEMPTVSSYPYVNIAKKYCPKVINTLNYI
ncbi:lactosylceramide 4-alpha-galactosyltransferase-like [Onthophagus taurus]|uniref:lactosylceramide 4-alpha-galactosyltransferase-like n=1 Tax=Onthophagus taurus TaxID=166361 RepID=UPI000C208F84|nr:lactosylceramide 4-alpha-galactosyltransferase-like [Onthophagus taurus]